MNEEVDYMVQMDPNMIASQRLIRMTFDKFGVSYDYATDDIDSWTPLSEVEWDSLDKRFIVPVSDGVLEIWNQFYPLGMNKLGTYVL